MSLLSLLQTRGPRALIRPLTQEDRPALEAMIARDTVGYLFASEQLELWGLPNARQLAPYRRQQGFLGIFEADETPEGQGTGSHLVGALWLGANCLPLDLPAAYYRQVARYILRQKRQVGSIFGPQDQVLGLWEKISGRMPSPFDLRPSQPLLALTSYKQLVSLAALPLDRPQLKLPQVLPVRWAQPADGPSLLPASVAMFTEEVGYDPMIRDPRGYSQRLDQLLGSGRSLLAVNREGVVVFKVDLGLVAGQDCQLQGVWLHPAYRGQKLAAPLLAQALQLISQRYRQISLYVNDYNQPARALYARCGFEQVGTYASILF